MIAWIQKSQKPVAVDLDHTLLRGNTTWFLCADLWRQKKIHQFRGTSWAQFKSFLAQKGNVNVAQLPYRLELLSFLNEVRLKCPLFLVTGTHQRLASRIAEHLGIFEEAMGSSSQYTLVHQRKADHLMEKWGRGNFIYIGDSWRDVPVWRHCFQGLAIPSSFALGAYLRMCPVGRKKIWILPLDKQRGPEDRETLD
jgi:phosphoserine phosphatase